jgi:hypothetical protein
MVGQFCKKQKGAVSSSSNQTEESEKKSCASILIASPAEGMSLGGKPSSHLWP